MRWAVAGGLALALWLALSSVPRSASAGDLQDLLRPGSRPAPGLAGDPFRTLLDPAAGDWGARALALPPGARLEAESSRPLDGDRLPLAFHGSRLSWVAGGPVRIRGRDVGVAARLTRPEWSAGWGAAANGMSSEGGAAGLDLALSPAVPFPGAAMSASFPVWRNEAGGSRGPAAIAMRWSRAPWLWLAGRATWDRLPDALRSTLGGEAIAASLNLGAHGYESEARALLFPGVSAEGAYSTSSWSPLSGRNAAPVYHLDPRGGLRLARAGVLWGSAGGPRLVARSTNARAAMDADLSWGGERFGHLNYAKLEARSWLLGIELPAQRGHGRWIADFESARAKVESRAEVESWPFTSTLVDLLGARRIYHARGEVRWEAWHAALERRVGRALQLRAGAGWYDLRPEAALDSWRPVFLVFGRADGERLPLQIARAQLAEVALGGDLRAGHYQLGLDVRQAVFGRTFDRPRSAAPAPSGETSAAAAATPATHSRTPAGGHFAISLSRRF